MRNKIIFILSGVGIILAIVSAYIFAIQPLAQKPSFNPAANPYANGIYANGIVESMQAQGENINIYPDVSGRITKIMVTEGAKVKEGDTLLIIDDSVQRAIVQQQKALADAALSLLNELKAQPRPETLDVATAQVVNAKATLRNAQDQLAKQEKSYAINPQSISREALDNARDAEKIAYTNLAVVQKQYDLTKAGAWSYDINNQEKQYIALSKSYTASLALLDKFTIKAPSDGIILTLQAAVGSYASPQGAYDAYTQAQNPLIVMGTPDDRLQVRAYIDEILVPRLADPDKMDAQMFIRGTETHITLKFIRTQPYVSPKIELSDQRQERVDVRVLPVIFSFENSKNLNLYPGQLVDVYVKEK